MPDFGADPKRAAAGANRHSHTMRLCLEASPMSYQFKQALTRLPGPNFAQGLTNAQLGAPDLETALVQHAVFCVAEILHRLWLVSETF